MRQAEPGRVLTGPKLYETTSDQREKKEPPLREVPC